MWVSSPNGMHAHTFLIGLCMSCICTAGASKRSSEEVRALLEIVWAVAVQPLVMGLAGASIHFETLPSGFALKALAVTAIGRHGNNTTVLVHFNAARCAFDDTVYMDCMCDEACLQCPQ